MTRQNKQLITIVLLVGLLAHSHWRAFNLERRLRGEIETFRNEVRDLGSLNARIDAKRGSMYYYRNGMSSSELEDALRKEMSEFGVLPANLGCQPVATDYTCAYNMIIRAHLIEAYGKDPVDEFFERQESKLPGKN